MNTIMVVVLKVLFPYGLSFKLYSDTFNYISKWAHNVVTRVKEYQSHVASSLFRLDGG